MVDINQEDIIKNWGDWDENHPVVTIRCTAYNHEKYISQAIEGFLIQKTTFPFEVVIHDDASTDNTAKIIKEYELKYPKIIKPIYEVENQFSKHDGSMFRIINAVSKGEFIAFCEGDDFWIDENKLQKQVSFLIDHPDFSACYSNVKGIDEKGNDFDFVYKLYPLYNTHIIRKENPYFVGIIGQLASCVVRRDLIESPKNTTVANGDVHLSISVRAMGNVMYFEEQFAAHRKTFDGTSWTAKNKNRNMFPYYYKSTYQICEFSKKTLGKEYKNVNHVLSSYVFSCLKLRITKPTKENKEALKTIMKECDFKFLLPLYLLNLIFIRCFLKRRSVRAKECKAISS